jgi:hypothetical protein
MLDIGRAFPRALILRRVVAKVTLTSLFYWEMLETIGEGPYITIIDGEVFYDIDEVVEWVRSCNPPPVRGARK